MAGALAWVPTRGASLLACAALVGAGLALAGCRDRAREVAPFQLRQFKQAQARLSGVFLNEVLVFHFSEPLDGRSVTRATVRIRDEGGRPAEGELWVEEERLEFRPRVPLRADLSDAGFQPGRTYTVELLGYPLPDGLRSRAGSVLAGCWRGAFHCASLPADPPASAPANGEPPPAPTPLFEDASIDRGAPLTLVGQEVAMGDPILLACAEPLDPRTISAQGIELRYFGPGTRTSEPVEPLPIAVEIRLARNDASGALLELRASAAGELPSSRLDPGEYHLWIDPTRCTLRDLGAHPCLPAWHAVDTPTAPLRVLRTDGPSPVATWRASFLDASKRSPKAVDGVDGTAHWADLGSVGIRFPLAAGDGASGALELGGSEARRDVRATRLSIPRALALEAEHGLCTLRAQGRFEVAGEVERTCGAPERRRRAGESHAAWVQRVRQLPAPTRALGVFPAPAGTTLTDFLASAAAEAEDWTVLIAGADLVISGAIRVDGPLLLVAGGWVRASGPVEASEVWILREGGGQLIREPLRQAPLLLDPPTVNALREPIHVAVMSAPLRPIRGVERWVRAEVSARAGGGRFGVAYLGEREGRGGSVDIVGPVDDPALLGGCQALQVRIDLWMEPGGVWDPPSVDEVEVHWDEPAAGRPRSGG
ncbi:MAG: hypothetical protein EPO68_15400 [Planctomycetota bacterium]|nr:MAG: hypothetical protein EPO68_15400 [Planctomycetota bacterium]